MQTVRKEGFFALYKGEISSTTFINRANSLFLGMASPLLGIAGVNSLLFAAYGASKRVISSFPQLSIKETAAAGAMAGAINAVLASPGEADRQTTDHTSN